MAASTKHHGCSLKHNLEDTEEGKSAESSKLWATCCKRVHTAYGKPNFNFISRHPLCLSGGIGNNNKKSKQHIHAASEPHFTAFISRIYDRNGFLYLFQTSPRINLGMRDEMNRNLI